jgi:hypothetical protein
MDKNTVESKELVSKRNLTVQEQEAIRRVKQKGLVESKPIFRTCSKDNKESVELALDESLEKNDAINLLDSQIMETTGSPDRVVGVCILENALKAVLPANANNKQFLDHLDRLAQSMRALAPQDEYEGQLVAQIVILHEHALEWLGRARRCEKVDFSNIYLNGASKLLARHHETLDALFKYRRRGEQRVYVEHVHVHDGGQAIVGNVTPGGGVHQKLEEGPHAKM